MKRYAVTIAVVLLVTLSAATYANPGQGAAHAAANAVPHASDVGIAHASETGLSHSAVQGLGGSYVNTPVVTPLPVVTPPPVTTPPSSNPAPSNASGDTRHQPSKGAKYLRGLFWVAFAATAFYITEQNMRACAEYRKTGKIDPRMHCDPLAGFLGVPTP